MYSKQMRNKIWVDKSTYSTYLRIKNNKIPYCYGTHFVIVYII